MFPSQAFGYGPSKDIKVLRHKYLRSTQHTSAYIYVDNDTTPETFPLQADLILSYLTLPSIIDET